MIAMDLLEEYRTEIRNRLCRHCIERPPGGPPCAPRGKRCGVELHLEALVAVAHAATSNCIDPYADHLHDDVCASCQLRASPHCPCPLDYLLPLAIEAVEAVDQRRLPLETLHERN
jgi:hypothetical protein